MAGGFPSSSALVGGLTAASKWNRSKRVGGGDWPRGAWCSSRRNWSGVEETLRLQEAVGGVVCEKWV